MVKIDKNLVIKYGAVFGLLIFLHFTKILLPIETLILKTINPVFTTVHGVGSSFNKKIQDYNMKTELIKKEDELMDQIRELTQENIELKMMRNENKNLRDQLSFLKSENYNYLMSNILSRGDDFSIGGSPEKIIIDKGLSDGLYLGLPVVSSSGVVIGRVSEVKKNISTIYLVNSGKCQFAAKTISANETIGLTSGELGLTIKMDYIPQRELISSGEVIITSGLDSLVPEGLIIGKVSNVDRTDNEIWQSVTIESLVNIDNILFVSVLIP